MIAIGVIGLVLLAGLVLVGAAATRAISRLSSEVGALRHDLSSARRQDTDNGAGVPAAASEPGRSTGARRRATLRPLGRTTPVIKAQALAAATSHAARRFRRPA